MDTDKRERLSRLMSYLLRHHPEEGQLKLDEDGMVSLESLTLAIRSRRGYEWVKIEHIRDVVESCEKQRFRIEGGRIVARYGHSRRIKPIKPGAPVKPPDLLYHGTPRRSVSSILKEGLKPAGRQFVHLSVTPQSAIEVGKRRDPKPEVLLVDAAKAHTDGIAFYRATDDIYLSEYIPPEYIRVSRQTGRPTSQT